MRKDAGLSGDLDRLPQLSWVLFLKCYDDMEQRREETGVLSRPEISSRDSAARSAGAIGPPIPITDRPGRS